MSKKIVLSMTFVVVLSLLSGQLGMAFAMEPAAPEVEELTIIWAQWEPANFLQQLVDVYSEETGVKVKVVQEPWGTFGDRVFAEFAAGGTSYDMVVGDSQWVGQGASQGHYEEITDEFFTELNGDAWLPATVTAYAEYPKGGGQYWAVPTEGDAMGYAYRTDLFEDPEEQAAFKEKYGYDLGVPKTWRMFRDIAEFFTRPEDNLYGVGNHVSKDYDCISMGYENVLYGWGGAWGDYETYQVDGILNAPNAVEALEFYKELMEFMPPGSGSMCWQEANDALVTGQIAMSLNFFAWFPGATNPAMSPYAEVTGFFTNPSGPFGDRKAALGGQALSIVSYIDDERKEAAMDFLKWFAKDETQELWAELGGYTCNANVLASQEFLDREPFNPPFAESMDIVVDFWAVPVYAEMLQAAQRHLNNYVVAGEGTAKETLDKIVVEHEKTLEEAGFLEK